MGNDRETNNNTSAVARQHVLNKQQLNYNNRGTAGNGVFYSARAKVLYNEGTSLGAQLFVQRRVGGWCEMVASLGVNQLTH
jgi:hypothetical protein